MPAAGIMTTPYWSFTDGESQLHVQSASTSLVIQFLFSAVRLLWSGYQTHPGTFSCSISVYGLCVPCYYALLSGVCSSVEKRQTHVQAAHATDEEKLGEDRETPQQETLYRTAILLPPPTVSRCPERTGPPLVIYLQMLAISCKPSTIASRERRFNKLEKILKVLLKRFCDQHRITKWSIMTSVYRIQYTGVVRLRQVASKSAKQTCVPCTSMNDLNLTGGMFPVRT
jgi:hypothetical protein